jgi:polyhydroxyalkanoate synthesis regulator phasin
LIFNTTQKGILEVDATVKRHLEILTQEQAQNQTHKARHDNDRANAIEAKVNRLTTAMANKGAPGLTVDALRPFVEQVGKDIAELKRQVAELQNRPQIKYLGVHKPDAIYSEASMVTRDGSVFYAQKLTRETPGDGCQDWVLAVKRGKDAVSR